MGKVKRLFSGITTTHIFLVIIFSFILIQIIAKISHELFGTLDLRLGFIFLLLVVFFALALMFMMVVKKKADLTKKDFFVLLILLGILILLFLALPKFIPEIFAFDFPESRQQFSDFVQSII